MITTRVVCYVQLIYEVVVNCNSVLVKWQNAKKKKEILVVFIMKYHSNTTQYLCIYIYMSKTHAPYVICYVNKD